MMNKKNILLALAILAAVVLTIVVPPTDEVYAYDQYSTETHVLGLPGYPAVELAGYYWIDFIYANTESAKLQRGGECPVPCNTHGEGEGYVLFIGYGDYRHQEGGCTRDASDHEQPWMTEEQREILWASTGACRAPELGQGACLFYCCQPAPPVMYWGWRWWDSIED